MALGIYTGGTANGIDGTLVSSSNKITFGALTTPQTVYLRTGSDTYTQNHIFTVPSGVEISFDNGSTWKGSTDSPYTYSSVIGDRNTAMLIRQTDLAASPSETLLTTGAVTTATALGNVSGLTLTATNEQIDLSWSAVSNRTYYTVERSTDNVTFTALTSTLTATTYSDTGLTNGTTYYYRVKAIGTGQYADSASWATDSVAAGYDATDNFSTNTAGNYTTDAGSTISVSSGVAKSTDFTNEQLWLWSNPPSLTNVEGTIKTVISSSTTGAVKGIYARRVDASNFILVQHGNNTLQIIKKDGGTYTAFTTTTSGSFSLAANDSAWLRATFNGNTITAKLYTSDPDVGSPSAARTDTYTLAGADATKFGSASSKVGLRWSTGSSSDSIDNFRVRAL